MKKTAMLFLIAVLMMTNVSISRADTGPIQVNGLINIGEGYEDEDFELTTTIYNNGAGYRSVTIEVQDNDIGLSVDKTSLRIPGNRGIDITITGRFPKVNNDITASLKIVDDLNYTNDQEIRFYASKVNKKDPDDPKDPAKPKDTSKKTRLSQVTNVKIRYDRAKQAYIVTWDPVKNATGYMIGMFRDDRRDKEERKSILTNKVEYKMPEVGKARFLNKVMFKIYAYSPKYLSSKSILSWHSIRRGDPTYGTMDWDEYAEQLANRNTGRRRTTGSKAGTSTNRGTGNSNTGGSTRRSGGSTGRTSNGTRRSVRP